MVILLSIYIQDIVALYPVILGYQSLECDARCVKCDSLENPRPVNLTRLLMDLCEMKNCRWIKPEREQKQNRHLCHGMNGTRL